MEFSKPGSIAAERPRARVGAAFSALVGWGAQRPLPPRLRGLAYRAFARAVGANLDEVELELGGYRSLGDFFARRLRHGARVIDPAPGAIISPCDGVLAARGVAVAGALVQAKGRMYQLAELVADGALAARLTGGPYATIYLSPRDYHRVHAPIDARILGYDYLPGTLWPVNPRFAARRDGLLARNERLVIRMHAGSLGTVALVMVGASGVGNIRLAPALGAVTGAAPGAAAGRGAKAMQGRMPEAAPEAAPEAGPEATPDAMPEAMIESAGWRAAREPRRVELSGVSVARGDELGAFRLGSTVVLVFEPHVVELAGEVGDALRFGQRIGRRDEAGTPGGAS